jgi:polar amino acid transport system substrate-binding protein
MNLRRSLLVAAVTVLLPLAATAQEALRVVTDATFPPMEFVKDGKRTGFDIELTEALGAAMGRKIEWIDIDFKGLIPALVSKRADLAMSAIYITDERRKVVDFSDSYFAGGLVVLTTRAGPIRSLKDLDGKKVSVQVGTKSVGYLKDNYPKVERVEVEKNQEMFNLVEIGRADAAVTGKPAAKIFAQAKPDVVGAARAADHGGLRHRRAQGRARTARRGERCAEEDQGRRQLRQACAEVVRSRQMTPESS